MKNMMMRILAPVCLLVVLFTANAYATGTSDPAPHDRYVQLCQAAITNCQSESPTACMQSASSCGMSAAPWLSASEYKNYQCSIYAALQGRADSSKFSSMISDFKSRCEGEAPVPAPITPIAPVIPANADIDPSSIGVCAEDLVNGSPKSDITLRHYDSLNIFNLPCLSDQSVSILKEVFGNALNSFETGVTVPNGFLIPEFLRHFNEILLTLVILIYSFILVIGTLNSAHEGTFMGKDWSSIWTPIRAVAGPLLIVPGSNGLCGAQMIILYLILLGVNMATALWAKSVEDVNIGVSPTVPTAMYGQIQDAAAQSILSAAVEAIMSDNPQNIANSQANFATFAATEVPLANVKDAILFDDVKKSMKNLCMVAYAVSPDLDKKSFLNPVSDIGQLPNSERSEAQSCINNVESMFSQGPSAYSQSTTAAPMPYFSKMTESFTGSSNSNVPDQAYWVAMLSDDLANWNTSCHQGIGREGSGAGYINCFPPVRIYKKDIPNPESHQYQCLDGEPNDHFFTNVFNRNEQDCAYKSDSASCDHGTATSHQLGSGPFTVAFDDGQAVSGVKYLCTYPQIEVNSGYTRTLGSISWDEPGFVGQKVFYPNGYRGNQRAVLADQIPDLSSPEAEGIKNNATKNIEDVSYIQTAPLTWGHYDGFTDDTSPVKVGTYGDGQGEGMPSNANGYVKLSGVVDYNAPANIDQATHPIQYALNEGLINFVTADVLLDGCKVNTAGQTPDHGCEDLSAITKSVVKAAEDEMNKQKINSNALTDVNGGRVFTIAAHGAVGATCNPDDIQGVDVNGELIFKELPADELAKQKQACKLVNVRAAGDSLSSSGQLSDDNDGPDIDKIDTRMDSSWWYAGQVYLQLDQQMADNLGQLNSKLQQLDASSSAPHFVVNMTATTKLLVAHDPNGVKYVGGDPALAADAYMYTKDNLSTHSFLLPNTNDPNLGGQNPIFDNYMTLSDRIDPRPPIFDHVAFEVATYHYSSGQALTGWVNDLSILKASPGFLKLQGCSTLIQCGTDPSVGVGASEADKLLIYLNQLPASEQLPVQAMLRSAQFEQPANCGNKPTNEENKEYYLTCVAHIQAPQLDKLYRTLLIMDYNGFLDNPAQSGSDLPAKSLMDQIFKKLLGTSSGSISSGMENIMTEVYSFGDVDMKGGSNLIGKNLSVISGAQRVGIDAILSVITSMDQIYAKFQKDTNEMTKKVQDEQDTMQTVSIATGTASIALGLSDMAGGMFYHTSGLTSAMAGISEAYLANEQYKVSTMLLTKTNEMSQQLMYLPLVLVIMTMMFAVGVTFALMLPLTPFILFWGGQMAWILGTIEAMVAAPLLALAWTYPGGGNHLWGHMANGMRMLLGVIFRPVLMVMGILIAMVLTYILITISAQGFHLVGSAIIGGVGLDGSTMPGMIPQALDPNNYAKGIVSLFLLFIYSQFIMKAFNKCFSAIYVLPEKVMQYIGGQADRAGAEDLQELSSGLNQSVQQVGSSGGQGMQSGIQGNQSLMQGQQGTGRDKLMGSHMNIGSQSAQGAASGRAKYKKSEAAKAKNKEVGSDSGE